MKYMKLDQKGNAMAEYIWIDALGGVRSKSKVRKQKPHGLPAVNPQRPSPSSGATISFSSCLFGTRNPPHKALLSFAIAPWV
jgi:hypothetical protein